MMISFFEIPARDLDRAERFYAELFGITLERGSVDGLEMSFFPSDGSDAAVGAIVRGATYVPSHDGTRVYFRVADLVEILRVAHRLGANVLYQKTKIGEHSYVAEIEDSERNRIALHELAQ